MMSFCAGGPSQATPRGEAGRETGVVPGYEAIDEALSLGTVLLGAGATGAITSLWPVNDFATSLLMCRLYDELARGTSPARALRIATLWLRDVPLEEAQAYRSARPRSVLAPRALTHKAWTPLPRSPPLGCGPGSNSAVLDIAASIGSSAPDGQLPVGQGQDGDHALLRHRGPEVEPQVEPGIDAGSSLTACGAIGANVGDRQICLQSVSTGTLLSTGRTAGEDESGG